MHSIFRAVLGVSALAGVALVSPATAVPKQLLAQRYGAFTQYSFSSTTSPQALYVDNKGIIWVSLGKDNSIVRMTRASGRHADVRRYPLPTANAFPQGVATGPDGAVWFAELRAGAIGRLDPGTGRIREYWLPNRKAGPVWVMPGAKLVWFTEAQGNAIAALNISTGKVSEFPLPHAGSTPLSLRQASDGSLWFPENDGNRIGRFDPKTGRFTEFDIPTRASEPIDVGLTADGRVWFTELDGGKVGVLDARTGGFREFALPRLPAGRSPGPSIIAVGRDGGIWFTEMYANKIAHLTADGRSAKHFDLPTQIRVSSRRSDDMPDEHRPVPIESDGPAAIVIGPGGDLWYTAMFGNKVGNFDPRAQ